MVPGKGLRNRRRQSAVMAAIVAVSELGTHSLGERSILKSGAASSYRQLLSLSSPTEASSNEHVLENLHTNDNFPGDDRKSSVIRDDERFTIQHSEKTQLLSRTSTYSTTNAVFTALRGPENHNDLKFSTNFITGNTISFDNEFNILHTSTNSPLQNKIYEQSPSLGEELGIDFKDFDKGSKIAIADGRGANDRGEVSSQLRKQHLQGENIDERMSSSATPGSDSPVESSFAEEKNASNDSSPWREEMISMEETTPSTPRTEGDGTSEKDNLSAGNANDEENTIPKYASRFQREMHNKMQENLRRNRRPRNKAKPKKKGYRAAVPDISQLEKLSKEEAMKHRKLWGGDGDDSTSAYEHPFLADIGTSWDWWQQAYRMVGGYIDCDHQKSDDDEQSNDNNGDQIGCSRWMIWASYVDPNYEGGGRSEYMDDDATGVLDCHTENTQWVLVGVYRQEFYQYLEQISKHLWAYDQWEYVATLASLAYMTDYDCFKVGSDSSGNTIYAGVQPTSGGYFEMALYTESNCLYPQSLGTTYDDYGMQSDLDMHKGGGSQDEDEDYDDDYFYTTASEWWYNAQEYTLSDVNEVYDTYKKCTLCMDYPTYQDGSFNGDSGYDEDDLINQCWKFYSHDSFTCETDCLQLASAQGTIVGIKYGDYVFGGDFVEKSSSYSTESSASSSSAASASEQGREKLKANVFLTMTGIMFIATFLAFGIARGSITGRSRKSKTRSRSKGKYDKFEDNAAPKRRSRSSHATEKKKEKRRSKSARRRLVEDDDHVESSSRRRRREKSRSGKGERRSDAESRTSRNSRNSRTSRSSRSRSRGKGLDYEPPNVPEYPTTPKSSRSRRSKSRKEASKSERERRHRDDF